MKSILIFFAPRSLFVISLAHIQNFFFFFYLPQPLNSMQIAEIWKILCIIMAVSIDRERRAPNGMFVCKCEWWGREAAARCTRLVDIEWWPPGQENLTHACMEHTVRLPKCRKNCLPTNLMGLGRTHFDIWEGDTASTGEETYDITVKEDTTSCHCVCMWESVSLSQQIL